MTCLTVYPTGTVCVELTAGTVAAQTGAGPLSHYHGRAETPTDSPEAAPVQPSM